MNKLAIMSKKKRNIFFKSHPSELVIWKRFLLFKEITPKLLSYILKGIVYIFPYANLNLKIFMDDLDYIYKLILSSPSMYIQSNQNMKVILGYKYN